MAWGELTDAPCATRASSQAGRWREGEVAPHARAHSKQGQASSREIPGGRDGDRAETPIQTYLEALRSGLHGSTSYVPGAFFVPLSHIWVARGASWEVRGARERPSRCTSARCREGEYRVRSHGGVRPGSEIPAGCSVTQGSSWIWKGRGAQKPSPIVTG